MKKFYSIALVALATISTQAQTPLNTNGSLEEWNGTTTAPDGWYINATLLTNGAVSKQTGGAQDGNNYIKIVSPTSSSNNAGLQDIDITAGETYTISYWYKSEGTQFKFRHWGQFRNDSAAISGTFENFQPAGYNEIGTTEWTKVVVSETAPAGATKLRVNFRNYSNSSAAHIDNVIVYQGEPASVKQNDIAGLMIYPNPANDVVTISSNAYAAKNIEIFDVTGKKVLATSTFGSVDISALNTGVYLLKVEENGKVATRKLIKK